MHIQLHILFLIILTACHSQSTDKTKDHQQEDSLIIKNDTIKENQATFQEDTLRINDQLFIQISKDSTFFCLTSLEGDTIIKPEDYYTGIELLDIDEDNYIDLRVFVMSNTPNQCDNYLFDKVRNTFTHLENCDLDIQMIKGTKYFYSYNGAGCADLNWESYLTKIENFRLIPLGYVYGQGCDYETKENPQVIEIYKITNTDEEKRMLIKTLPYLKHIPENDGKIEFIENYWAKNYRTFER